MLLGLEIDYEQNTTLNL